MFGIPEDHFDTLFPTTTQDLARDQAYHLGRERPGQAWILTSWDTWEPNPFYDGPEEPHPELYDLDEEESDISDITVASDDVMEALDDDDVPY